MIDDSDDLQEMERSEDDHEHDSEDEYRRVAITDHAGNFQQLTVEEDLGEWERDDEDGGVVGALRCRIRRRRALFNPVHMQIFRRRRR